MGKKHKKKHKDKKKRRGGAKADAPVVASGRGEGRKPSAIKTTMTKRQIIDHLVSTVDAMPDTDRVPTKLTKKIVTMVVDELASVMQRSIAPGGAGKFILPRLMKIELRTKKAIKAGTMVRSPSTGGMVPSKGRPASKTVKLRPLVGLKKAAAGEL